MNQIRRGTITQWFGNRKFGFIEGSNGQTYFFHLTEWSYDTDLPPTLGQKVMFEPVMAEKGLKAIHVVPDETSAGVDALRVGVA